MKWVEYLLCSRSLIIIDGELNRRYQCVSCVCECALWLLFGFDFHGNKYDQEFSISYNNSSTRIIPPKNSLFLTKLTRNALFIFLPKKTDGKFYAIYIKWLEKVNSHLQTKVESPIYEDEMVFFFDLAYWNWHISNEKSVFFFIKTSISIENSKCKLLRNFEKNENENFFKHWAGLIVLNSSNAIKIGQSI